MDLDEISMIAQKVSFAYEDLFFDENKKNKFVTLFEKYLEPLDPGGRMELYDLVIQLGRTKPEEFDRLVKKMEEADLIKL